MGKMSWPKAICGTVLVLILLVVLLNGQVPF